MASISAVHSVVAGENINQGDAPGAVGQIPRLGNSLRGARPTVPGTYQISDPVAARVDHAQLSGAGTLIAHALKLSDVRGEKVAALQQRIAAGRYDVPATAVAGKLLESLLG